ncbi:MAG TPA: serine/threonine-protein kinase [Planctomycetota bacterium]|nr:serine/threonine-protein kinase [Planctomycetota bacterium]
MPLADYAIESEIGRGGMGRVVRATHVPTGAKRAVKVLALQGNAEAIARFRLECEALARARSAGAIPIHETGLEQGRFWFSMDLLEGGSLRDLMKRRGPLPAREAADLVAKLARMVARCHELGLVHRDLKPENILFDATDTPRLGDFGCVRDLSGQSLTATGETLGTPDYMAPEQLDGLKVDGGADVFSLGVILHELVAGERPFAGRTWSEHLLSIGRGARKPLASEPGLEAVLTRALAPKPGERISARQLAELLESLDRVTPRGALWPLRLVATTLVLAGVAIVVASARRSSLSPAPSGGGSHDPAPVVTASPVKPAVPAAAIAEARASVAALASAMDQVAIDMRSEEDAAALAARRLSAVAALSDAELASILAPLEERFRDILAGSTMDNDKATEQTGAILARALDPVKAKLPPLLSLAPVFLGPHKGLSHDDATGTIERLRAFGEREPGPLVAALAYDHAAEIALHAKGASLEEDALVVELLGRGERRMALATHDDRVRFGHRARHRLDYLREAHKALARFGPQDKRAEHARLAVDAALAAIDAEGADANAVYQAFKNMLELEPGGERIEAFFEAHRVLLERDLRYLEYLRAHLRQPAQALELAETSPRFHKADRPNLRAMQLLALCDLGRAEEARKILDELASLGRWNGVLDYLGMRELEKRVVETEKR